MQPLEITCASVQEAVFRCRRDYIDGSPLPVRYRTDDGQMAAQYIPLQYRRFRISPSNTVGTRTLGAAIGAGLAKQIAPTLEQARSSGKDIDYSFHVATAGDLERYESTVFVDGTDLVLLIRHVSTTAFSETSIRDATRPD